MPSYEFPRTPAWRRRVSYRWSAFLPKWSEAPLKEHEGIVLQKMEGENNQFAAPWGGLSIPFVSLAASPLPPRLYIAESKRAVIIKTACIGEFSLSFELS